MRKSQKPMVDRNEYGISREEFISLKPQINNEYVIYFVTHFLHISKLTSIYLMSFYWKHQNILNEVIRYEKLERFDVNFIKRKSQHWHSKSIFSIFFLSIYNKYMFL